MAKDVYQEHLLEIVMVYKTEMKDFGDGDGKKKRWEDIGDGDGKDTDRTSLEMVIFTYKWHTAGSNELSLSRPFAGNGQCNMF